jgi:outer membrane protein OmpA-like peptidoglycan-associated protein
MRIETAVICLGTLALGLAAFGCSVSMSASAGSKATLVGKEKIVVSADQPPPPPPPERKAKVVGKKIEITEKVMFDTAKATIKPESHQLLNDVALVMKEHTNIKRVRIEGHTDSDGTGDYNKKLSQERADAVKAFLVEAGVEEKRLTAVGYGEDKPIADNDSDEGKERNRRVEFNILKQTKIKGRR